MRLGLSALTLALFGIGFGGVLFGSDSGAGPIRSFLEQHGVLTSAGLVMPKCDAATSACRDTLRAKALKAMEQGRGGDAEQLLRPAALRGDARAMFFLGWVHEEAYRTAMGPTKLRALSTVPEESVWTPETLSRSQGFEDALNQVAASAAPEPEKRRRLAWLWYMRAAIDGFAPAMNNIGSMYQFGVMGPRERKIEQTWYERGSEAGNVIALLNLLRIWNRELRDGTASCEKILFWSNGNVRYVPRARAEDMDDAVLKRTRFRGRMVPDQVRAYLLSGSRSKMAEVLVLAGIVRPDVSQSELYASQRALPEDWVFDADPDEREADLARFKKRVSLSEQAEQCTKSRYRSTQSDHYKLERVRDMESALNRPRRRW